MFFSCSLGIGIPINYGAYADKHQNMVTSSIAVEKAITPGTRLVHIETPDNPTVGISDIAAIAEIAHRNGALLSVDNTFASR